MATKRFYLIDTNFLREMKSPARAEKWLEYCKKQNLPMATNLLFPPTMLIEYAGSIPSRQLPRFKVPTQQDQMGEWVQRTESKCRKHYDNDSLTKLVSKTYKRIRRRIGDARRSEFSKQTFRAARQRWKNHRKVFRSVLLKTLTFNAMTSASHGDQERLDTYLQLLLWVLDLWAIGWPIPFYKLTHLTSEHLREIAIAKGKDVSSPGFPDPEKLGRIKALDLGDSEYISFAVLGFPITKGSLVSVDVFTADPVERATERIRMSKEIVRALSELLVEKGFGDRLKLKYAPGRVHFFNDGKFLDPLDVSAL